jgi:hypothetical protein
MTVTSTFVCFLRSCGNDDVTSILTLVANMKKLRILPGAAGLIALTATMGFVDGQREIEAESFSRGRITLVRAMTRIGAEGAVPGNKLDIKSDSPAYLVEIRRGDRFAEVLIDAVTGRILLS